MLALSAPALAGAAKPGGVAIDRGPKPRLIMIHGGSFLYQDPSFRALTRRPAREAGFVPIYLDYPLGNVAAAHRAARQEALRLRAEFGDAVYAYGSSAGGTLAEMLAGEGLVSAAVAKAPISDFLAWDWPLGAYGPDYFERIGLGPAASRRLSPLRRPARRPVLILHGRRDRVVPLAMSRAYSVKFTRVRLWVVRGGHHTERIRPRFLRRAFVWLRRFSR